MLSADTWRAVSTVVRNLVLTWLIMLPLLTAVMLLGQLYFLLHPGIGDRLFDIPGSGLTPASAGDLLIAMIPPLVLILGWIGVMAIAWLLCNREVNRRRFHHSWSMPGCGRSPGDFGRDRLYRQIFT